VGCDFIEYTSGVDVPREESGSTSKVEVGKVVVVVVARPGENNRSGRGLIVDGDFITEETLFSSLDLILISGSSFELPFMLDRNTDDRSEVEYEEGEEDEEEENYAIG